MQQPLCHLYFLTVVEHLQSRRNRLEPSHLSGLVRTATSMQTHLETAETGEAVLLWVELQAVMQVLIQQLAEHLDPAQPHKVGDLQLVVDDINRWGRRLCHMINHTLSWEGVGVTINTQPNGCVHPGKHKPLMWLPLDFLPTYYCYSRYLLQYSCNPAFLIVQCFLCMYPW